MSSKLVSICPIFSQFLRLLLSMTLGFLITRKINVLMLSPCSISNFSNDSFSHKEKIIELDKDLVLIGVMTTKVFIKTRAKAVYETWGKDVPGKIIFFTSEQTECDEDLPVVYLSGVDDSYPPQKKSFMMLKYMYDHYLDDYEFFMRVDDDLHLRSDQLTPFLTSISNSRPLLIGQPGVGTKEEKGKLGLTKEERFCMGGPGIVFNKLVLTAIVPHIETCMKNFFTPHEDVELWRCVKKHAKVDCTKNPSIREQFFHDMYFEKIFRKGLHYKDVLNTITLHNVKNSKLHYNLDIFLKNLQIKQKDFNIINAIREIDTLGPELTWSLSNAKEGSFYSLSGPISDESKRYFSYYNGARSYTPGKVKNEYKKLLISYVLLDLISIITNSVFKISGERVIRMVDRNTPGKHVEYIVDLKYSYKCERDWKRVLVCQSKSKYFAKININYGILWVHEVFELPEINHKI